jgi:nucleotide-binding universal stress UspA family protein
METLKSILVAVDMSSCSRSACLQAVRIASRAKAALHVLHVVEPLVIEDLEETLPKGTDVRGDVLKSARQDLEEFTKGLKLPAGAQLDVVVGPPLEATLNKAQAVAADLILLGAYGTAGAGRGAGTLASHIVRKSPTDVMLVDERHTDAFRSAMVGVDFSDHSARALEMALRVAKVEPCPLHVVHVFEAPWHRLHYRSPTPQASPDYQRQFRAALEAKLEAFVKERHGVAPQVAVTTALLEHKSYAQALLDYAAEHAIDLVVVGTLGRTNLRYMLLGSTAERVVRESPCSVMAVPPREAG